MGRASALACALAAAIVVLLVCRPIFGAVGWLLGMGG